jgi:hypothetical protein
MEKHKDPGLWKNKSGLLLTTSIFFISLLIFSATVDRKDISEKF